MILAIVGPTASGKTAVSLEVARLLGGPDAVEIISADAMQLYRGMDIGTAKLLERERQGITHHQLDVLDIVEEASVAAYQRHARADLERIQAAGKLPIIVGGSGLYVSALVDELSFPGRDPEIRAILEAQAEVDMEGLRAELRRSDPEAYETIDLANPRRVIRALEVIRLTGRPFTPVFPRHTSHYPDVVMCAMNREMNVLTEGIRARAEGMIRGGLLDETRTLLAAGLAEAPTAARATGYREAIEVIRGGMTPDDAVERIAFHTRRLAKKQVTWFRADPRVRWFDLTDGDVERVARDVCKEMET